MSHCIADVVRAAATHVPTALVDPVALARVAGLAATLPAAFNWAGFECRLHPGDDRVDFGVCIDSRDRGRDTITAALAAGDTLPGLEFARPLLSAWVDPETPLNRACPVIWAEWDLPPDAPPRPFAFVCVDPEFPGNSACPPVSPAILRQLATATVQHLTAAPADPATLDLLDRCARTLPPPARVLHLAPMPPDRGGGLRVHTSLPVHAVVPWLRALAWPGEFAGAERALALLGGAARVGLQFGLGEQLLPYLGLEYYAQDDPRRGTAWHDLLARLVAAGLTDPGKAEATLRWYGDETVELPDARWFVNIQRQFYIKLVVAPELAAKVYLTLHPRYIPW